MLKKITCILFIIIPYCVSAEMYKWVDEDGNTHYTQSPPPGGIESQTIKPPLKVDSANAQSEVERQTGKADELRKERQEKKNAIELQKENEAVQKENCKRAKQRLATYSRPRGLIEQEDGSRVRITEEERQAGLKDSQEMIEKYCSPLK